MNFQLSLTEYSAKYKVSISTLRRRIKKNEVEYVQDGGKYILPDVPFDVLLQKDTAPHTSGDQSFDKKMISTESTLVNAASPQESRFDSVSGGAFLEPLGLDLKFSDPEYAQLDKQSEVGKTIQNHSSSLELEELKKAYTQVLSEKESQILQLKQHIVDLQTLNKALENEAERLSLENTVPQKTSFSKYDF